jgi:hypothetical protein
MYSAPHREFIYGSYKLVVGFADNVGNMPTIRGTCFFLATKTELALVTNRHMLDYRYGHADARESMHVVAINVVGKTKGGHTYSLPLLPQQEPRFARKRENDIACFINPRVLGDAAVTIFHHFDVEGLAREQYFAESLLPGEQIFFAGYPEQYDRLADRPLMRSGIIASDPRYPYSSTGKDEGDRIAYEGFSSEGASGSAVWASSRSFEGYHNARAGAIVGVNGGHYNAEYGGHHTGISFFYKSSAILELLAPDAI